MEVHDFEDESSDVRHIEGAWVDSISESIDGDRYNAVVVRHIDGAGVDSISESIDGDGWSAVVESIDGEDCIVVSIMDCIVGCIIVLSILMEFIMEESILNVSESIDSDGCIANVESTDGEECIVESIIV